MRDFNHTVNVLVKAFFEGKLEHGNCHACAVGNIVHESMKGRKVKTAAPGMGTPYGSGWPSVFCSVNPDKQIILPGNYESDLDAKIQIDSTGYTWQELAKIERAFEDHNDLYTGEEYEDAMFNGLMAVVDVLADIHGIDLKAKEEAKALFVKA
jgi:hypothetical protein